MSTLQQSLINHVVFVLDGSGSMERHKRAVISVVDGQIARLAKKSQEMNQETRVTVYVFDSQVECVLFDQDAMRLASIKDRYWVRGRTALIDATIQSQKELAQTYAQYGDHAFLTFVITDGEENASYQRSGVLTQLLAGQPDNWTVAALVPNRDGQRYAENCGFPPGNISIWDTNSATGMAEVGERITKATDSYFTGRATGTRGSTTLFAGSAQQVNAATVAAAGLKALNPDSFFLFPAVPTGDMKIIIPKKSILKSVPDGVKHVEIKEMVESTGRVYELGKAFYELEKSEKVTANKNIAVIERKTHKVYVGRAARDLIGLGDTERRIKPMPADSSGLPPFKIFVQSQSTNRNLRIGSQVLLLK